MLPLVADNHREYCCSITLGTAWRFVECTVLSKKHERGACTAFASCMGKRRGWSVPCSCTCRFSFAVCGQHSSDKLRSLLDYCTLPHYARLTRRALLQLRPRVPKNIWMNPLFATSKCREVLLQIPTSQQVLGLHQSVWLHDGYLSAASSIFGTDLLYRLHLMRIYRRTKKWSYLEVELPCKFQGSISRQMYGEPRH